MRRVCSFRSFVAETMSFCAKMALMTAMPQMPLPGKLRHVIACDAADGDDRDFNGIAE